MDENQLMQLRSFGRTSLVEVKRKLAGIGLALGWQPGQPVAVLEDGDFEAEALAAAEEDAAELRAAEEMNQSTELPPGEPTPDN
jgi:hypothetical protein